MPQSKKYRHWPTLLKEFDESGLTQSQFCLDRNINPKYFSTRRGQLLNKGNDKFVKAKISKTELPTQLTLRIPNVTLHFDTSVSPTYIASLMRALS